MTVRRSSLDHGFRLVTDSFTNVESVAIGLWVKTGTRHETPKTNGISHFLEHMAFKGTTQRSALDIAREIENVGGFLNAATSRETTFYYARVLKKDIFLALDLLIDINFNAVISPQELESERGVILQELYQTFDTPDDIIFDYYQETAYPQQPLGYSILGPEKNIRSFKSDNILDFMQTHYATSNMLLSAVGNLDHDALTDHAEKKLRGLPQKSSAPRVVPARYRGGDFRQKRDLEQVHVLFGLESVASSHPHFYGMSVLSTLLGGGMSSRLFQEIREKRGLAYSVYTDLCCYQDTGLFSIYAGTSAKHANEVIALVCEELNRLEHDLQEEEIKRAQAQLKSSVLMTLESPSSRMNQLAHHMVVFDAPRPIEEVIARIDAIGLTQLKTLARALLKKPLTLTALGAIDHLEPYEDVQNRIG